MTSLRLGRVAGSVLFLFVTTIQGVAAANGELADKLPKSEACISKLMVALSDSKWSFYDAHSLDNRLAARKWDCYKSSDGYLLEAYRRLENYASSFEMDMGVVNDNFASISRYQAQQRSVTHPVSVQRAEMPNRSERSGASVEQLEILARLDHLQKKADQEAMMRSLQRLGDSFNNQPAQFAAPQAAPINYGGREKETVICRNYGGIVRCESGS